MFRSALAIALALVSAQAAALGLGQIEVRSKINEPLLAEIPVIYSDPSELEQLQARLASPETFARVGLEAPRGTVADLQFAVALDARGQTVIRVTSSQPVNTSLLVFLVEVDSGQSRVVREYSALIDAPRNAPVAAGPVIQAPQVAMPNTVTRPPVVSGPPAAPSPVASTPIAPPPSPATPPSDAAQPGLGVDSDSDAVAVAPSPTAAAPAPPVAAPAPGASPAEYGPVKSGQTLSQIAGELGSGYSLDQTMIALLRANPDAFIGEDINFIKRGAVLRVPQPAEISGLSAAEASVLVQSQLERWREAQRPAAQPVETARTDTPAMAASSAQPGTPAARRVADARLEIVPSASSRGTQAGTRSGASAGGEGEMLRQQLQQNKEDLAARDAEVVELQTRIAELEKLQQQQGQLLTLKDSELAAAQQRLAESNRGAAATPAATAAATTIPSVQSTPATTERDMGWLWPLGIVVLALAALLGWWFSRRRRVPAEPTRRQFDTESLAASFPAAAPPGASAEPVDVASRPSVAVIKPARAPRRASTAQAMKTPPAASAPVAVTPAPVAPAAASEIAPAVPPPAWTVSGLAVPTWHSGGASAPASGPVASPPLPKTAIGQESLELARAYIDLGDDDTARSLLQEVIDIGDADARTAAARMLREMPG